MEKVVRDGKVAVIVSPGYGAGWSSWDGDAASPFDPVVVAWIEAGKPEPVPYSDDPGGPYTGGLPEAVIEWLPVGTQFRIDEYDGNESLVVAGPDSWQVA